MFLFDILSFSPQPVQTHISTMGRQSEDTISSSASSLSTMRASLNDTVDEMDDPSQLQGVVSDKIKSTPILKAVTHLEPTRFPSLTFIKNPNMAIDRETSIKNVNLKAELIENTEKIEKHVKESLFMETSNHDAKSSTFRRNKAGSTATLYSISTENTGASEFEDARSNFTIMTKFDHHINDDNNSLYQQSFNSNCIEQSQKSIGLSNSNIQRSPGKTESFIYNDLNSVDILSHNAQRKISSNVTLLGNNAKDLQTNNLPKNIELDFLDNQSISTIITATDNMSSNFISRSPTKRNNHYNNVPVSPTYSKVRQVSHKLFGNYNSGILSSNNNDTHNSNGINNNNSIDSNACFQSTLNNSKISLQKRSSLNFEPKYGLSDGYGNDFIRIHKVMDENNQNSKKLDSDNDEHTGFTDAESILAKPYKNKNKYLMNLQNNYYKSSMSSIKKTFNRDLESQTIKPFRSSKGCRDYGSMADNDYFDPLGDGYVEGAGGVGRSGGELHHGKSSPHDYKSMYYKQNLVLNFLISTIYIFALLLILFSILKLLILKNFDNILTNFEVVNLSNVLISDEVLLLDIETKAINANLQDVNIWTMDLDVFLVTNEGYFSSPQDSPKDITILLGNSQQFLTPMRFRGLIDLPSWYDVWNSWRNPDLIKPSRTFAQLKIYQPGKNFVYKGEPLTREQWDDILNRTYKLKIRGNLEYSLPLAFQNQFISISTDAEVLPS